MRIDDSEAARRQRPPPPEPGTEATSPPPPVRRREKAIPPSPPPEVSPPPPHVPPKPPRSFRSKSPPPTQSPSPPPSAPPSVPPPKPRSSRAKSPPPVQPPSPPPSPPPSSPPPKPRGAFTRPRPPPASSPPPSSPPPSPPPKKSPPTSTRTRPFPPPPRSPHPSPPPSPPPPPPPPTSPPPPPGVIQARGDQVATDPAPVWPVRGNAKRLTSLVMVINLCGQAPKGVDPQFMRQRWYKSFATPQTAKDGTMDSLVTQCSFGKWAFNDFENLVVPVVVNLPCSGRGSLGDWSASTCRDVDRQGWAEAAMRYLTDNTDIDVKAYTHKLMIFPTQTANCNPNLAALAMQNCAWTGNCYIWSFGETSPRSLLHEVGHNMGLFHSWVWPVHDPSIDQYGDIAALMGMGPTPVCWNAPQGQALGINSPIAQLNAASLPAGSWQTIRLPPSFVTDSNFVSIAVSWMADPVLRRGYLYLSYKLARLAEAGLPKELDAHVHIHSYTGDLTLAARNYSMLVGNISAGEQWPPADQAAATAAFPWRLLVLARSTPRDTSSVDAMTATVQICRFTNSPSECGTAPAPLQSSGASTRSAAVGDGAGDITATTASGDGGGAVMSAVIDTSAAGEAVAVQAVSATTTASAAASGLEQLSALSDLASSLQAGVCGDGVCGTGESMLSCPSDCCGADADTAARCGDGRCDAWAGENCVTCPSDCARVRPAGSSDILPFPIDASGHFQFLSHDMPPSSGLVWWCCGGGELGDGCGEPACAAPPHASGSNGGSGSNRAGMCRATCAAPLASRRHLLRTLLRGAAAMA
ncbi:hypothetical protein HXX76_011219 [Chlamydomonas incerta]|uniref:Peptidase M11 gametolysin domain-containing protein n=1 Tax=Chlamydomonas incerta TaxID=51695 RepID=A0A835SYV8_CHLIN|nr:hypothetical protein HXX76_011219 [Chlamydomonas incerta]|eukprot:KAG2428975.1 hypothetical protein HXX76_011219 [Chlamydomonas incerta]